MENENSTIFSLHEYSCYQHNVFTSISSEIQHTGVWGVRRKLTIPGWVVSDCNTGMHYTRSNRSQN